MASAPQAAHTHKNLKSKVEAAQGLTVKFRFLVLRTQLEASWATRVQESNVIEQVSSEFSSAVRSYSSRIASRKLP